MAARLVSGKARVVAYMPSFRSMINHFRTLCTYDESHISSSQPAIESPILDSMTEYPDPRLGPLGPKDKRFPMPGLMGPTIKAEESSPSVSSQAQPDVLTAMLPYERQALMIQQFLTMSKEVEDNDLDNILKEANSADAFECQAISCPDLIRKDFQDLFPFRDLASGPLTVITVSQKTVNDMTGWNPEVEEEREQMLDQFVSGAQEICDALQKAGYWADFIDPSSGRPYLGDYTHATMFETDERYRHFGFEIDDLGCCKVISHHLWGVHAYVGCLFTNAPITHPVIKSMLSKTDWED